MSSLEVQNLTTEGNGSAKNKTEKIAYLKNLNNN